MLVASSYSKISKNVVVLSQLVRRKKSILENPQQNYTKWPQNVQSRKNTCSVVVLVSFSKQMWTQQEYRVTSNRWKFSSEIKLTHSSVDCSTCEIFIIQSIVIDENGIHIMLPSFQPIDCLQLDEVHSLRSHEI